jgi:hypothetical protein
MVDSNITLDGNTVGPVCWRLHKKEKNKKIKRKKKSFVFQFQFTSVKKPAAKGRSTVGIFWKKKDYYKQVGNVWVTTTTPITFCNLETFQTLYEQMSDIINVDLLSCKFRGGKNPSKVKKNVNKNWAKECWQLYSAAVLYLLSCAGGTKTGEASTIIYIETPPTDQREYYRNGCRRHVHTTAPK